MRSFGNNISIKIDNLCVSYNDSGTDNAETIIFLHGFPLNKSMWDRQADALKNKYRVIAYDIRGHGNSEAGIDEFFIELFVNDLVQLMNALKIDKAVLCGLSMGGYIALSAIEKYPHRFEALVLSDTQCMADTPEAKEKRLKTIGHIKEKGVENYADESLKMLFAPESFITNKEEIISVKEMIINTSKQSLFNTLIALSERKETCSSLQDIEVPVLIMAGKEDKITPPDVARMMHEKIQNSALNIIEHAGHLANMENPDEFNYQLEHFLDQVFRKSYQLQAVAGN